MKGGEAGMKLKGKVAIVTGAGQGIGRAIALSLAREGADVVVNDINLETGKSVSEEIKVAGHRALAIRADVTKSKEVKDMIRGVLRDLGRIDILVNNAGGSAREKASEFSVSREETWDSVLNRNLKGVLICTRAVINHMIERQSGKIINIASLAGVIGMAGMAEYSAAKAGIIGFTKALAKEVGRYGINVNCVSPGPIKTIAAEQVPKDIDALAVGRKVVDRVGEPQDVANLVVFLASDDACFITGQNYSVDGGSSI
jgi:NAD(P)-dependent dehydrogenase (short-subunit alcohol dehydrogenase family)